MPSKGRNRSGMADFSLGTMEAGGNGMTAMKVPDESHGPQPRVLFPPGHCKSAHEIGTSLEKQKDEEDSLVAILY